MEKSNNAKMIIFFIFLILIIVSGYFAMKKSFPKDDKVVTEEKENKVVDDIRIDKSKDYIYFSDTNTIIEELDIAYTNVTFNFEDKNNIAKKLNDETIEMFNALEYDEEKEDAAYNKLSNAEYKKYQIFSFDNYISLLVNYYRFDSENLVQYKTTKTYVFDSVTGELYNEDELLNEFNLTKDDVIEKIKNHVDDANLLKENEQLDSKATVDGIENLPVFVDKVGRLSVSILVKSDLNDYNDIININ